MRLSNCGPPVSESDIVAFERRVGVALPDDYRQFLIEVNGGDGSCAPTPRRYLPSTA